MPKYHADTKLGIILKDEAARAIVAKYLGEAVLKHPLLPVVKMFTVKYALRFKEQTEFDAGEIDKMVAEILALE